MVSIIIIRYNTPELTLVYLHSVYSQTPDLDFELLVPLPTQMRTGGSKAAARPLHTAPSIPRRAG